MSIHSSDRHCNATRLERKFGRGERAIIQGQLSGISRSRLNEIQDRSWTGSCVDGWTVRHCMVVNNFQVKGTGRTLCHSIRCKDCTGEVVPLGEVCLGRNHSESGAKLNMRWMRGVFVGKLDRTDGFLLKTPTGAMKTRCVRRLEGDNAWDLQFLNLCVGSPRGQNTLTRDSFSTLSSLCTHHIVAQGVARRVCIKHVHPHLITCRSLCCFLVLSSSSVSRASTFSPSSTCSLS